MARKKKHPEHVNHERWLVSYADFITLLFAFFVVMFAVSQVDSNKVGRFTESVRAVTLWNGPPLTAMGDKKSEDAPPAALIPTNVVVTAKTSGVDLRVMRDLLRRRLRSAIINSRISIEQDQDLVVRLQDCGMFEAGSDKLVAQSVEDIRVLGEALRGLPFPVRIEGHTDSLAIRGSRFRNNWELSAARAVAVLECLSEKAGMPDKHLSIAGYADTRPVADNSTEEGRRRNRRVDIVLTEMTPSANLNALQRTHAAGEDAAPVPPGDSAPPVPASPTDAWIAPAPRPEPTVRPYGPAADSE